VSAYAQPQVAAGIGEPMEHLVGRIGQHLLDRVEGPFKLRLIVQPLVAATLAVRAGLRDQRAGEPPFLWALASSPERRGALVRGWWKDSGTVFLLAMLLDAAYQLVVTRTLRLGEMVAVASLLAILPYVLLRGLVTRLSSYLRTRDKPRGGAPTARVT
jgi:hypothetical protein